MNWPQTAWPTSYTLSSAELKEKMKAMIEQRFSDWATVPQGQVSDSVWGCQAEVTPDLQPYLCVVGAHGPRAPLWTPGVALVGVGVGVVLHLVIPGLHVEARRAIPAGADQLVTCQPPSTQRQRPPLAALPPMEQLEGVLLWANSPISHPVSVKSA